MDDLIARLEASTGPSRDLDVLIAQAVGEPWGAGGYSIGGNWGERAARYTASIDVALTLVPAGLGWGVDAPPDMPCVARCQWPQTPGMKAPMHAHGATPAIALCIACLKARSATP